MICLIKLKKLTKILAISTVLFGAISCLVPKSAIAVNQVILNRMCDNHPDWGICPQPKPVAPVPIDSSGVPNSALRINFNIDTAIDDLYQDDPNRGFFPKAVQNASFTCVGSGLSSDPAIGCPDENLGKVFPVNPSDLIAYRISDSQVQYETTLSDADSHVYNLVIDVSSSDPIFADLATNSLFALSQYLVESGPTIIVATVQELNPNGPTVGTNGSRFDNFKFQVETTEVPEPGGIGSLLGTGAIGTLLMLKRIGRSWKLTGSRRILSE